MATEVVRADQPGQVRKNNSGKNGIRRWEGWYRHPLNGFYKIFLFPEDIHASDITRRGVELVRDGSDMVLGQPEPVSRLRRSKSKGVVTWGFFLDAFDGIRSRIRGESGREGALLDLAADRTQEGYLGLNILLHNWRHMDKRSDAARQEFLDLLMIPTATILPTLAAAQGRMLGITIPEKSPTGGSRFDRFMKLNRSFRASVNGNYKRSNEHLRQMLSNVEGAYNFRSERTIDYRTHTDQPTTFDPTQFATDDPVFSDHKARRDELETWIHFVWFLNKTVALVTDRLREANIDPDLITAYQKAVEKQLGGYQKVDKKALREKWHAAYPDEFVYALSEELTPQALLGIEEQPRKAEPVPVYEYR